MDESRYDGPNNHWLQPVVSTHVFRLDLSPEARRASSRPLASFRLCGEMPSDLAYFRLSNSQRTRLHLLIFKPREPKQQLRLFPRYECWVHEDERDSLQ